MPSLERLYRHFSHDSFELLAINVGEKRDVVLRFARRNNLSFKVLLDEDTRVSALYGVRSHPMKFLVDAEGKILGLAAGYRNWYKEEMKSLIRSLIDSSG